MLTLCTTSPVCCLFPFLYFMLLQGRGIFFTRVSRSKFFMSFIREQISLYFQVNILKACTGLEILIQDRNNHGKCPTTNVVYRGSL
ncbi:hypothetical protein K1719_041495 [Acacia pycnantha]|nr:hypothetical protein K1719_041495 [Acacia pycnantha]